MIGKASWFRRRKYGGWGLTPATKQGWIYVALAIGILVFFTTLLPLTTSMRILVSAIWLLLLFADVLHIMATMKKDEREFQHEAIAERNAFWGVLAVLVIGILYDLIQGAIDEKVQINWWMAGALSIGVIVKSITNYYLEKHA